MIGTRNSQRGWNGGDEEEEHHDDAMHGEQLVVGLRLERSPCGVSSSSRIITAKAPPRRRRSDGDQVQQRDALVSTVSSQDLTPNWALI